MALQSLDAQAALLPYALLSSASRCRSSPGSVPIAADHVWMTASFAMFAINWAVFYGVIDWIRRQPEHKPTSPAHRVHVLGGLLWAGAVAQITAIALGAGPARAAAAGLGGAAVCIFFSAQLLAALLIVSPAAAAAPMLLPAWRPGTRATGRWPWAAIALVMALSLILNRLLRRSAETGEVLLDDGRAATD